MQRPARVPQKSERLFSSTIVEFLLALPSRPWPHANKGNSPINQQWLAHRLLPLGINPQTIRIGDYRAKGYFLADFAEAFTTLPNENGSH